MKMLLGLTKPTSGEVKIWGKSLQGNEKKLQMCIRDSARELTRDEKKKIRTLVTGMCANYDRESGLCLPLDLSLIHI